MESDEAQGRRDAALITLDREREVVDLVGRSILGLWNVVNDLTRMRPVERKAYRVTIFGSGLVRAAREPRGHGDPALRRGRSRDRRDHSRAPRALDEAES